MKTIFVIVLLVASAIASPLGANDPVTKHCDKPSVKENFHVQGCNLECTEYYTLFNNRLFPGIACAVDKEKICEDGTCKALPADVSTNSSLYLTKVNTKYNRFEYRSGQDKIYLCLVKAGTVKTIDDTPLVDRSRCITCDYDSTHQAHNVYCEPLQQLKYDVAADTVVLEKWAKHEDRQVLVEATIYSQFPHSASLAFKVSSIKLSEEFNGTLPLHSQVLLSSEHFSSGF